MIMQQTLPSQILWGLLFGLLLSPAVALAITTADQADTHFQAGEWQSAATAYQQLSEQHQNNDLYWFRLGQSRYNLRRYQAAIEPLQQALKYPSGDTSIPAILLLLARCQAAAGDNDGALDSIAALEASGARPYQTVKNAAEFSTLLASPEFQTALNRLKPCATPKHRAFDLWIGEWQVTSPTRPNWSADSSITVSNDGCSIHERYVSAGGYAGSSISFYDAQKQRWHQTWIDNQGTPIYLEGNPADTAMVLGDATNRVTWSVEPDNRVRQHWQSTTDGGTTWSTVFDGYYSRK